MGVRAWQQKAQCMLGIEAPEKAVISIKEENDALRIENNELKSRIGGLEDKFDQLISALNRNNQNDESSEDNDTPEPKKRGRRKKE